MISCVWTGREQKGPFLHPGKVKNQVLNVIITTPWAKPVNTGSKYTTLVHIHKQNLLLSKKILRAESVSVLDLEVAKAPLFGSKARDSGDVIKASPLFPSVPELTWSLYRKGLECSKFEYDS